MLLKHAGNALDLSIVPLLRGLDLLSVEAREPDCLAVVWALTGNCVSRQHLTCIENKTVDRKHTLVEQPLLRQVRLLGTRLEADFALSVVLLDHVLDDGAGFPEREIGVRVVDCGHAAVGVHGEELGLLDVGELDILQVVCEAKFFGEHADFRRVGAMFAVDGDGFEGG
jgi:hypothetical protein